MATLRVLARLAMVLVCGSSLAEDGTGPPAVTLRHYAIADLLAEPAGAPEPPPAPRGYLVVTNEIDGRRAERDRFGDERASAADPEDPQAPMLGALVVPGEGFRELVESYLSSAGHIHEDEVGAVTLEDGVLSVRSDAEGQEAVARLIDALRASVSARVHIDSIALTAREAHALRTARLQSRVIDIEGVSGGTGFALIERQDPFVQTAGDGAEFRVQVEPAGDGERAILRVDGVAARLLGERRARVVIPVTPLNANASEAGDAQATRPPAVPGHTQQLEEFRLSLPRQAVRYWDPEPDIPVGREVLLDYDSSAEGNARLLVGRVRRLR